MSLSRIKIRTCLLVAIAAVILGCSAGEKKRQLYLDSKSIAPLKIPAPLKAPVGNEVLSLPYLGELEGELEAIDPRPPSDLPEEANSSQASE